MENIGLAFQLMIVGMMCVFLILLIVIQLGKVLIKAVNKWAPEEVEVPKKRALNTTSIDAQTLDIIKAAVNQLTGGKGSVKQVERI